ncbi:MAG: hypothetical protein ACT4OZ_16985 [Gemmatimonadota bacterium]
MFIEFIDSLRCRRGHGASPLIAVISASSDRQIIQGTLGCAECGARYDIRDGVVDFRTDTGPGPGDADAPQGAGVDGKAARRSSDGRVAVTNSSVQGSDALRFRALLDLGEPGGTVALLCGAEAVLNVLDDSGSTHFLVINGRQCGSRQSHHRISRLLTDPGPLPLVAGSLRAAQVGKGRAIDARTLASLAEAVAPGGRIVAPAELDPPEGVRILARDDHEWVAVKEPAPGLVQLRR